MLGGGAEARTDRAFERLYRRYVADVYRYACAVLANPADAEDVSQTVFLNAYRAFRNGTRPDDPLNWLIAITHNACRQRFRDGSRRPREVVLDPDVLSEPERDEEGFRREDILRALSQLSLNQRAALAMRELEGRSYAEIAGVLGTTKGAVETLLFRARRSFREQLEGSLTCTEAERAISLQLDGMLPRGERGSLRAHLRGCPECASLARRFRAQGSALRGIGLVPPLPPSPAGGFALGGGGAVGTAIGVKAVAVGAASLVVVGVGTDVATNARARHSPTGIGPKHSRVQVAAAELRPTASLVAVRTPIALLAPVKPQVRAAPATRRLTRPRLHKMPVAQAPPAVASALSEGLASAPSARSEPGPAAPARESAAARQQPQLSGGGPPAKSTARGPGVQPAPQSPPDAEHSRSAGVHGRGQPLEHPAHPEHPVKPDHPAKPENPLPGNNGTAELPVAPTPPADAPEPTGLPDPPATDLPPDPAAAQGGPPADPTVAEPPKQPKGKSHEVVPPPTP
jgi:RNA polymerase sigma-70 factor, ECF subfamily